MREVKPTFSNIKLKNSGRDSIYLRRLNKEQQAVSGSYSKKVGENVYLLNFTGLDYEILVHRCEGESEYNEMTFRENDDGPMYWCEGCGFVLGNGEAMAIRLYEAPFS